MQYIYNCFGLFSWVIHKLFQNSNLFYLSLCFCFVSLYCWKIFSWTCQFGFSQYDEPSMTNFPVLPAEKHPRAWWCHQHTWQYEWYSWVLSRLWILTKFPSGCSKETENVRLIWCATFIKTTQSYDIYCEIKQLNSWNFSVLFFGGVGGTLLYMKINLWMRGKIYLNGQNLQQVYFQNITINNNNNIIWTVYMWALQLLKMQFAYKGTVP